MAEKRKHRTERDKALRAVETAEENEKQRKLSKPRTKDRIGRVARAAAEIVSRSHTQMIALDPVVSST